MESLREAGKIPVNCVKRKKEKKKKKKKNNNNNNNTSYHLSLAVVVVVGAYYTVYVFSLPKTTKQKNIVID